MGEGILAKIFSIVEVWIFSETVHCNILVTT